MSEKDFGNDKEFDHFVKNAVTAYTVVDKNLPEFFRKGEKENALIPLEYDLTKRLEFWEWWLMEAIPQAWAKRFTF